MSQNYKYFNSTGKTTPYDHLLPDGELQVDEFHLNNFFGTMFERQEIWYKRNVHKKKQPWTEDEYFAKYKFTNVYRELDFNTQWEINNIIRREDLSFADLIWQISLFRYFNEPKFFEWIRDKGRCYRNGLPRLWSYDKELFYELIQEYRATGNNPFTNAYTTNSKYAMGNSRDWCFGNAIVPDFHEKVEDLVHRIDSSENVESFFEFLKTMPGLSEFTAYEFYTSYCYITKYNPKFTFRFTEDCITNVGPGASLAIRLIFPNLKPDQQIKAIYVLCGMSCMYFKEREIDFKYMNWNKEKGYFRDDPNFNLHNIEMWLCEYQKYWKMSVGLGRQRSLFYPRPV